MSHSFFNQSIRDRHRPVPGGHHGSSEGLARIPPSALCFFLEGTLWCCVRGDFINLQESVAGFGKTMEEAMTNLLALEFY